MHKIILVLIFPFAINVSAQQQKSYYKNEMTLLRNAIETNFYEPKDGFYKETAVVEPGKNPFSYLWPLCGMIQAGNEIEKATKETGLLDRQLKIIREYYVPTPPAPGYASYIMKFRGGDRFYDDNQWIGIASMDAYSRAPKPEYLAVGKEIYNYMMTGYDSILTGGIYWQENKKVSKNTCSNGPGIILALQLYKATQDKKYLDTAIRIYQWVNAKLQAPNGLYWDNIGVGNNRIGKAMFSYNTGTMLQSNIYLYEITKKPEYIVSAKAIADTAISYFNRNGKFRDSYWFQAVLLRSFQHLLKYDREKKYILAFKACLDTALATNKNDRNLMGKEKTEDLVAQSGMLEILARFAQMEGDGIL